MSIPWWILSWAIGVAREHADRLFGSALSVIGAVRRWAEREISSLWNAVGGAINSAIEAAERKINELRNTIGGWIDGVRRWVESRISWVTLWISNRWNWEWKPAIERWLAGVRSFARNLFDSVKNWVLDRLADIGRALASAYSTLRNFVIQKALEFYRAAQEWATRFVDTWWQPWKRWLEDELNNAAKSFDALFAFRSVTLKWQETIDVFKDNMTAAWNEFSFDPLRWILAYLPFDWQDVLAKFIAPYLYEPPRKR